LVRAITPLTAWEGDGINILLFFKQVSHINLTETTG